MNIAHVILNANSIWWHVIQIKNEMIKYTNVIGKIIISVKKIIVGIIAHVFVKTILYLAYSFISDQTTLIKIYYLSSLCKRKRYTTNWKILNLKKVRIKTRTCYNFDDIIKLEDFHLGNILTDKKITWKCSDL